MVWTSRPQQGSSGAEEAGGDASETQEEEVMSFHKEANSLTSSLNRTHRRWQRCSQQCQHQAHCGSELWDPHWWDPASGLGDSDSLFASSSSQKYASF